MALPFAVATVRSPKWLTALHRALKCNLSPSPLNAAEHDLNENNAKYSAAAEQFLPMLQYLLHGELSLQELLKMMELWDKMQRMNDRNRAHYSVDIVYLGSTHEARFDHIRAEINLCLQIAPHDAEDVDEDVTEVDATGLTMDAGQADDFPGK